MAAHLKTGISQVIGEIEATGDLNKGIIESAVNWDCWTADDTDTWRHLYAWVTDQITQEELVSLLKEDQRRANAEWEALGQPKTREEWYIAKYGPKATF